ncbi:uncharacterized protein LOC117206274 [Bombus bifarius]|uniref:Uncharacterized protein LOC117206274 n=1 Tax=Bombus bifarius TaxID=103933 RepID=A0A6P8MI01_9HYME|nr:uncharacterized protein LOC117156828 [Bombus vancouverensis nearcticus]XP_033301347.1 uncharacterized protein LOC117206274 [Bombus bifarius]
MAEDGTVLITDPHCQRRSLTTMLWHRLSISPQNNSLSEELKFISRRKSSRNTNRCDKITNRTFETSQEPGIHRVECRRLKIASWTGLPTLRPGSRSTRAKDNGIERSSKRTR